jgi:NAD-dependent SIR2 family protein deacetylase
MEELEKLSCVSCRGNFTYQRIQHKETKKKYPLCLDCIRNGFYNENIFDVIMVRSEPPVK